MKFFNHIKDFFIDSITGAVDGIAALFMYFIAIAMRGETAIAMLIAAAASLLLLIAALILMLIQSNSNPKADRPKSGRSPKSQLAKIEPEVKSKNLDALMKIEQDMLALKERYSTGRITVDNYKKETKSLYDSAKALN